ncbi:tyrosine-type recombinase/integrase [Paenibacillus tianjinensis]|uniref:Site-specific integrase n=1 Tax=Paenibacillus tianjinensis TaxID=2810347 RepID=A0ABX7L560_9BACL|nr:site-specific integrase [Paenibacillus tianjinensis]QSF42711.1 site-specific integrase [Paenibacillus tianjinensis]
MTTEKKRSSVPVPKKIPANNKQGYKWRLVIEGPPNPITGERKQIPRVRDTQKEVIAACQDEYKRLEAGFDSKRAKTLTFEQAGLEWIKTYSKLGKKGKTVETREEDFKTMCLYMGKVLVASFKHNQYQKIINKLDDDGYSLNTIKKYHTTTNLIFKWVIKEEIRDDNPCIGISYPKKQLTVEEIKDNEIYEKYLDRNELYDFLDVLEDYGTGDDLEAFYFLLFSGTRPGELCALEWPDINSETFECHIYKTIFFPRGQKGRYELTPPKTKKSIRKFLLDEFIINMLKKLKIRQEERYNRYKELNDDFVETQFIFTNTNGTPYRPNTLVRYMERLLKLTDIKKHATPHIFRHTHITMLIEASLESGSQIDLKTIMDRVGHDDSKTTLGIYTHVTERMKQQNSEIAKFHFENILNRRNNPTL